MREASVAKANLLSTSLQDAADRLIGYKTSWQAPNLPLQDLCPDYDYIAASN